MRGKLNLSLWLGRFRQHQAGAGAVEFAIIAPVLLLLVFGGSELGVALTIDRKVKAAAGYAVDLVSQSTSLSDTDLQKLFGLSKGTLAPYSIAPFRMRVIQIKVVDGKGTVDWSCQTRGYDALAKGTPVSIPPNLAAADGAFSSKDGDHGLDYASSRNGLRGMEIIQAGFPSPFPAGSPSHDSGARSGSPDSQEIRLSHLPASTPTPGTPTPPVVFYVLRGETSYDYAPVTGAVFKNTVVLSGINYSFPRYSSSTDSNGCATFNL